MCKKDNLLAIMPKLQNADKIYCDFKNKLIKKRKMLQKSQYVTELLNVCYNSINWVDNGQKKNKIVLMEKDKI